MDAPGTVRIKRWPKPQPRQEADPGQFTGRLKQYQRPYTLLIQCQSSLVRLQPSRSAAGTTLVTAPGYLALTTASACSGVAAVTVSSRPAASSTEKTAKSGIWREAYYLRSSNASKQWNVDQFAGAFTFGQVAPLNFLAMRWLPFW